MKRRIVHALQKYLLNPPIKLLFVLGLAPPGYALLETIGRKTGTPRRTSVGNGRVGGQFWIVAEHGEKAGYVRNIAQNSRVRVKLRNGLHTRWHTGRAHVLPDDDPLARQRWLGSQVQGSASNAAAVRFFGPTFSLSASIWIIDSEVPRALCESEWQSRHSQGNSLARRGAAR
jgi:deazaflavin-dependent oxidoreductase (nitroreductase family)